MLASDLQQQVVTRRRPDDGVVRRGGTARGGPHPLLAGAFQQLSPPATACGEMTKHSSRIVLAT